MASKKEYLNFVLEQLSELEGISYRAMMGEYLLYYNDKLFGGIYDDRFLVKVTASSLKILPDAPQEMPYDGAKPMLLVTEIENKNCLKELIMAMYEELSKKKIILKLKDKDDKKAYEYSKILGAESAESDRYLHMLPEFADMLDDKSSYVRTRGFILICNQARWAKDGQIADIFDKMSTLLYDSKPTVVRQCLLALHEVALYRPEMSEMIIDAVDKIDVSKYKDSMSPLIEKDINELMKVLS